MKFGPDDEGNYEELRVTNIKRNCTDIDEAYFGDSVTTELESTEPGRLLAVDSVRGRFLYSIKPGRSE